MPIAAPRLCARCNQPTQARQPCQCRPPYEHSQHRGTQHRGLQLRKTKLRATPICQWPGCRLLATEVDHITPLAEGGARYQWDNLQSLCHAHHAKKTAADAQRGKTRPRG